jgi:Tfp pilus assembly protein PilF
MLAARLIPSAVLTWTLYALPLASAQPTLAEKLIDAGHWKRARALVEARLHEAPEDALSTFLLSQIRAAFGDRESPLPLAEKAVALDPATAKYHRQAAEVLGILAQHSNLLQQLVLARRFRKELDTALALDGRDPQALRDLMEYYLLAPGVAGGDARKAAEIAARLAAIDACEGWMAQARLAEVRKDAAARQAFARRAVEAQPQNYRARMLLARLTRAEEDARAALELDPGRVDAYSLLASIYARRGAWSELDSTLAAASREVPGDATPFYRAAEQLMAGASQPERVRRYLRIYLAQPSEGNEPTAAQAEAQFNQCEKLR